MRGVCKWFNEKKGFGFIVGSDQKDVFVHHSKILGRGFKTLLEGEVVEYQIEQADKGPVAVQVKRLNTPLE